MGHTIELSCTTCNYSSDITLGSGMMHHFDNVYYGFLDKPPLLAKLVDNQKITEKALSLIVTGAIPPSDYNHGFEPYVCPKCCYLESRFYFRLQKDNECYEPDYICNKCDTLLKSITFANGYRDFEFGNDDFDSSQLSYDDNGERIIFRCPDCDNDYFKGTVIIYWD